MTSLSLQYGHFHYSPFANIQTPTTSIFSTDFDETGIKMHGLLRSYIKNIVIIRVAVPFKLRNSKWCSVSSLTIIEYSSDQQRLSSDCPYAQADLRLCWSHIPHCWKFHALAQLLAQMNLGAGQLSPKQTRPKSTQPT